MENYSVSLFLPNSMIGLAIKSDYKKKYECGYGYFLKYFLIIKIY
jgi:hypothetical protein